jgi:hypothetical protein
MWNRFLPRLRSRTNQKTRPRTRLSLEALEDRFVPSASGSPSSPLANAPTANDDIARTDNNPVTIDVLANDTDPAGSQHLVPGSVTVVTPPARGTLTPGPNPGELTYTPERDMVTALFIPGYGPALPDSYTATFQYVVSDDTGATSAPATVTVAVQRSYINDDIATTAGSTPVTINVLANDNPGQSYAFLPSTVSVSSPPQHGSAAVDPNNGLITYTPDPGFRGTDAFRYTVRENDGKVYGPATVSVLVGTAPGSDGTPSTPVRPPPQSVVWVNPAWADLADGAHPDGSAPGAVIGVNAFGFLQDAVTATAPGGTVNLAAGTYPGAVSLAHSIILHGAGSGATIVQGQGTGTGLSVSGPGVVLSGLTVRGFDTGLVAGGGTTYLALNDVGLTGNAFGGAINAVATVLFGGSAADETFFARPGLVARQGDNPLAVNLVHNLTVDGGGGSDRLVVYLDDTTLPDTVWLTAGAVARQNSPFLLWYRSSGGSFGGGVAVVLAGVPVWFLAAQTYGTGTRSLPAQFLGPEVVVVQGQLAGAPTTVYGGIGHVAFDVAVTSGSGYAGLTLDGGAGASSLAVFDTSGGARLSNAVSGAGQGEVDVAYADGTPSRIGYQNLGQVLGDLPRA